MQFSDFEIGKEFLCGDDVWRCTDRGSRVITAIKLTNLTICVLERGIEREEQVSREDAEEGGWFTGPPYAVGEVVFDEYDQEGCEELCA